MSNLSSLVPRDEEEYGCSLFTVKMRHGGRIEGDKYKSYVGAEVDYFDLCDGDRMSMHEINDMVKECGYNKDVILYYYLDPRSDINNGLKELQTDEHIR